MRSPLRSALLVAVAVSCVAACTPEPKLTVVVSVRRSIAHPILATFAGETGADLDMRFVERAAPVGDDFDVLWTADPWITFEQAESGRLAPLPSSALRNRPARLVDPQGLWVAVTADLRVIAYDPQRVDEATVPTRFEELIDPAFASRLAIAKPTSPSASWHIAALFASKGSQPTAAFFRDLGAAGAKFVDSERDVVQAVAGDGPPIGVLDGEVAFGARELGRRIGILIPDQDAAGAIARATTLALNKRAADRQRALDLVQYLLSPPVGRRLGLMSSHLALLPEDQPTAGALTLREVKIAAPSQPEIAAQLSEVRRSLADLH